jgi:hypothetical protein
LGLLTLCIAILGGYSFVTGSDRVKRQAEGYLGRLVGGEVEVAEASLGIFDGLRLGGVTIRTPTRAGEAHPSDRIVFQARSVTIDYDPIRLLVGEISASRIVAIDPHVRLIEDDQGIFNASRLGLFGRRRGTGEPFRPPEQLPEIRLRNAQIDYARRDDQGLAPRGGVGIEAQFEPLDRSPAGATSYAFDIQTRQSDEQRERFATGPRASGTVRLGQGDSGAAASVDASVSGIDFGSLIELLPRDAALWARRHALAGRVEIPTVSYRFDPTRPLGERVGFDTRLTLTSGRIQGLPAEWLPRADVVARPALRAMAIRLGRTWWTPRPVAEAAFDVGQRLQLVPLRLDDVAGTFRFTDDGVTITGLSGDFQGNRLRVNGLVGGYGPDAPLDLTVSANRIRLDEDPYYLHSLPRAIREAHARFRPAGRASLMLQFRRGLPDTQGRPPRPVVTGRVEVLGGRFALDRLPYPIHDARGRLLLRHDPVTGQDRLILDDLRGFGPPGTVNESARVAISGSVAPLGRYAGFDITVAGSNVRHEPGLVDALPGPVRRVLHSFRPTDGNLPSLDFAGDFTARVARPPGPDQRWMFDVGIDLTSMAGAFDRFPFPITDGSGRITVGNDSATLQALTVTHDDTQATLDGTLDWSRLPQHGQGRVPLRYDLDLDASGVTTSAPLLSALPRQVVDVLENLGIRGTADVAGTLSGTDGDLAYDLSLDVARGTVWPEDTLLSLGQVKGTVEVRPGEVVLRQLTARRGDGTITLDGRIGIGDEATTDLTLAARDLALDAGLYDFLPPAVQEAWDWLDPAGRTQVDATYAGPTATLVDGTDFDQADYDVRLRPDRLSVKPAGFPYPLRDLAGEIIVTPDRIEIVEVSGQHVYEDDRRSATLSLTGLGVLSEAHPAGDWQLAGSLKNAAVDATLIDALPQGLADATRGVSLAGAVSVDFDALRIRTRQDTLAPDVDFQGELTLADASLDIGIPLAEVVGSTRIEGSYARGSLQTLAGTIEAESFTASGRGGEDLTASFVLDPDRTTIAIDDVSGRVAGGVLDGSGRITLDDGTPDTFRVAMNVVDLELSRLFPAAEGEQRVVGDGRLTARLDLRGGVGRPDSREGRGSIRVDGERLYSFPLVLGLLQVTYLALPIAEPFDQAQAQFTLSGQQVVIAGLELSAGAGDDEGVRLTGGGTLDFATGDVRLLIKTGNRGWDRVPILGDIVGLARDELVSIEVVGTLENLEVGGSTLPTVRGTFDRIFAR